MVKNKRTYSGDIVIVEGKTDKAFLECFTTKNITSIDGYYNLKPELQTITNQPKNLENINSLLVIVDADDDINIRKLDLIQIFDDNGLKLPDNYQFGTKVSIKGITVGIFIMPDNSSNGSLETLVLQIVKSTQLLPCIDGAIACRNQSTKTFNQNTTTNQIDKTKLELYISMLLADYEFNHRDIIDSEIEFNDTCFANLKSFI